jgi:superfamily II DNA or RNA helicase
MKMYLFEMDEPGREQEYQIRRETIKYRPYQIEAIDSVFGEWETFSSTLVVSATGTGKSVIFSGVMERFDKPGRYLVLAHREELIRQAVQHARNAGLSAAMEMAGYRAGKEDVIVSTIQTQSSYSNCRECMNKPHLSESCNNCGQTGKVRRFTNFNPMDFGLIIIDEAHHATADSYRMVLEWYRKNPDLKILLVTATPKRGDDVGLHNVCESVAFEYDMVDAIADGYLVPVRQKFVEVSGLDLSAVKTQSGDLSTGGVEKAFINSSIDEEYMLHQIAKPTVLESAGRPTILFAPGQEYAKKITAAFNAYEGVTAECIVDSTPREARREIINRYKTGQTQILVNCMVFTEGFDAPNTAVVANCRPTKSESLYRQMIGRGTRPLPGIVDSVSTAEERMQAIASSPKPYCTVLDFVGNSGRHKLVSVVDVLSGDDIDPVDLEAALKYARKKQEALDMQKLLEEVKQKRIEREEKRKAAARVVAQTKTFAENARYTATDVDLFYGDKSTGPLAPAIRLDSITKAQLIFITSKMGWPKERASRLSKKAAGRLIGEWIEGKNKGKQAPQKSRPASSGSLIDDINAKLREF